MAKNVILPALGMAQETGKIVRWLKSDGDRVAQGEAIAEIETDKVTVELEAPISGTLSQISAAEGDDVPVGRTIAVILAPNEAPAFPPTIVAGKEQGERHAASPANGEIPVGASAAAASAAVSGRIRQASPKARRIAAERGLDITALRGSGPNGAVLAADVLAAPVTNAPVYVATEQV
ncbi:MAG TPA: biotin/lipoyl-containing protein, partial [Ktedonobacterales bacterium]|nr:biotin/lipoyl-containing protein [Ktedonobacterales bacterium]